MTTLRQIAVDALRESGLIQVGSMPEADEFDEAIRKLQAIIKSLYGTLLGDKMTSVSFGSYGLTTPQAKIRDMSIYILNSFAPVNSRVVFNIDTATTIQLPPNPEDGARFGIIDNAQTFDTSNLTISANGRRIEDSSSVVLATKGLSREWFYRADLGNWMRVTDIDEDDESPFPYEFDDLLITTLAFRLNPRYGVDTKAETITAMKNLRTLFRARYNQVIPQSSELALLRLTHDDFEAYRNLFPEESFNHGFDI